MQQLQYGLDGQDQYDSFICLSKTCKSRKKEKRAVKAERRKIRTDRKREKTISKQLSNEEKTIKNETLKTQAIQNKKDSALMGKMAKDNMRRRDEPKQKAPPKKKTLIQTASMGKIPMIVISVLLIGALIMGKKGKQALPI